MKKLLLIAIILCMATMAHAEPISISDSIKKLPNLKQGVVYSQELEQWLPMTTATVLKVPYMEDLVNVDFGYVGPDKMVFALSVSALNLSDWLNITVPILDSVVIEPCAYYGLEKLYNGDSDDDWGFGSSVLEFTF